MSLFADLSQAEDSNDTDELLIKQDIVFRRISLDDLEVGKAKEADSVASGLSVQGETTQLTQTGAEVQVILDKADSEDYVKVSDGGIELTQTGSELQEVVTGAVTVDGNGGELVQTLGELQDTLNTSLGVDGQGGDLSQTFTEVQDVISKTEEFNNLAIGSSTQSIPYPNGLIMKVGVFTESVDASTPHSWDDAFPNGILSISATTLDSDDNASIHSPTTSGFVLKIGQIYGDSTSAYVQAWGY